MYQEALAEKLLASSNKMLGWGIRQQKTRLEIAYVIKSSPTFSSFLVMYNFMVVRLPPAQNSLLLLSGKQ